ncbi:MAG: NAD(P)-binding domain-containing protein [Solirubrobacterales bacterium]
MIGAGSSGLAAVKTLAQAGVPVACFEVSDRIGGNWAFGNPNGMSAAYRSLHINTSKQRMEFSDFPMPDRYPDYLHHSQVAEYFTDYADHFGLGELIRFETEIVHADRRPEGGWELELAGAGRERFDALVVANGHHWDPRWPEPAFPGHFNGIEMHAHEYVDDDVLRGRRVVVLGMGNSAMDIAVDASHVAERTVLAARRGAHVIPKHLFGKPTDHLVGPPWIPFAVRRRLMELVLGTVVGPMTNYGLPEPDHRLGAAHPTASSRILDRVAHGLITPRPTIAELRGDRVRFADGSEELADVIVYCTGYRVTFPFFDPELVSAPDNDLALFRRVFHPTLPALFFVGLLQPLGAVMPLAELQGAWIADHLRGRYALPSPAAVRRDMRRERTRMFRRYVRSARHTMQVDFDEYLWHSARERRRGARRAAESGAPRPVPVRAAEPAAA